jgi:hypothetical protein
MSFDSNLETYDMTKRPYVIAKGDMNGVAMRAFAWGYPLDEPDEDEDDETFVCREWEWRADFYDGNGECIRDAFVSYGFSLETEKEALDYFEKWCAATGFTIVERKADLAASNEGSAT